MNKTATESQPKTHAPGITIDPTPAGEYLSCGCTDPGDGEGAAPVECGQEAVAVWNVSFMGQMIFFNLHACLNHDLAIKQGLKSPDVLVAHRSPLKRVDLVQSMPKELSSIVTP
ncbi:MAG: hypothetical protein JWO13_798 [Acidobacteriales bacterium]|nr:hypothetical protein [Terriglobales bacterium]